MLLDQARVWIRTALTFPNAKRDTLGFLEQLAAKHVSGSLLYGRRLMKSGKPCLARWDGHELIRLNLSRQQESAYCLRPNHMTLRSEYPVRHQPPALRYRLTQLSFDTGSGHDGRQALTGECQATAPVSLAGGSDERLALEASYYHPALEQGVTNWWHPPVPYFSIKDTRLRFEFSPLFSGNSAPIRGPLVVYVRLSASADWGTAAQSGDLRRVSDVATATVELL